VECKFFEIPGNENKQKRPKNVELFLYSERPKMQQAVIPNIPIKVTLFMQENLNIGSEYQRGIESIKTETS
jgi:hypothetical protein